MFQEAVESERETHEKKNSRRVYTAADFTAAQIEPAIQGSRCLKHLVKARERQRKKRGLKRRYFNTLSYRLESAT